MADQLELLKRLQALDAQLFRLRRQQQEKPQELEQAMRQMAQQEARRTAAEEQMQKLQVAQKEQEIELQGREEHIKKLQGQLFQVKTNKEYAAMQREIESLKADCSLIEEAILKTLDAIDEATRIRKREQDAAAEIARQTQAERQRIERELEAIGDQMAQLERSRQGLAPQISSEALTAYQRVLELRDGLALVPLLNDACGGCNRRLPPQVINEVYLKATLVSCEQCNRILYFDDAQSRL